MWASRRGSWPSGHSAVRSDSVQRDVWVTVFYDRCESDLIWTLPLAARWVIRRLSCTSVTSCRCMPREMYADIYQRSGNAAVLSPNSITPTFTEISPRGKLRTSRNSLGQKRWQIMKSWSFGESRWHKSRKSRTQTILTCWDVCDKVCDMSASNSFVSL